MAAEDHIPNVPAWGYREGEARIFDDGILPKGWVDSPAKVKPAKAKDAEPESNTGDTIQGGEDTISAT